MPNIKPRKPMHMDEYGMPQPNNIPEIPTFDLDVPPEVLSPEQRELIKTPDPRMVEEFDMEPIEKFDWEQEPFDDSSPEAGAALMMQNPRLQDLMQEEMMKKKNDLMRQYGF